MSTSIGLSEGYARIQFTDGMGRYEQLTLRANALREELHTEIEKMLNDIIKFKVHVQKSLEDYEGFVVEEVEAELGGDGEDEGAGGMGLEDERAREEE